MSFSEAFRSSDLVVQVVTGATGDLVAVNLSTLESTGQPGPLLGSIPGLLHLQFSLQGILQPSENLDP